MKLIDKNGRFSLVSSGREMVVDRRLPKHVFLKEIGKGQNGEFSGAMMSSASYFEDIDNAAIDGVKGKIGDGIVRLVASEDAREINAMFRSVLGVGVNESNSIDNTASVFNMMNTMDGLYVGDGRKPSVWERLRRVFYRRDEEERSRVAVPPDVNTMRDEGDGLTFEDLMSVIHVEAGKERVVVDRVGPYVDMMNNAIAMGQTAFAESIAGKIVINLYESVLFANGFNRYISFSDMAALQRKCDRLIDIDYIRNFTRSVPGDVLSAKERADRMCVFDNYCVVYYDPSGKSYGDTEGDRQRKKDPILFGLIKGSDRLYYIADWVDDYCDLTLEQVASKIGGDRVRELTADIRKDMA